MDRPTLLITGPTGSTGRAAAEQLLAQGHSVRVLAHSDDERLRSLRDLGAEVVLGDLLDFRAVQGALRGVARAYFVYPIRPGLTQATVQFAQAAKEAGLEFIVNMSQISAREEAKSHAALEHWLCERVFEWYGVPVAHLRPTFFADWLLYGAPAIRKGILRVSFYPEGRHAPVAAEDQASVIAAILADPTGHAGRIYPLYGPTEVTQLEAAEILSRVLGKEIKFQQVTSAQTAEGMGAKENHHLIQHLHEVATDHRNGVFAGTNDLIRRIGHREPMTLEQFITKYRTAFL